MTTPVARTFARDAERWSPALLLVVLVAVYAPSLAGGFLSYDDRWLVAENPLLRDGLAALRRIVFGLDEETRLVLGAEYLPVRDLSHWLEARLHGLDPRGVRAGNLGLYLGAVLAFRTWLRALLGTGWVAEATTWLFALHPVHVESVAWIAGRKDVLALLFVGLALVAYARRSWLAVAFAALALLSKGVAVVTPLLFVLHDRFGRQRSHAAILAATGAVTAALFLVSLEVGRTVDMVMPPLGGSRAAAFATMGPVVLRYLQAAFAPFWLSVAYDVTPRAATNVVGWLAWLVPVAVAAWAVRAQRRGDRLPLFAVAWFAVTLAPTSQVLVPLQNVMADRYLLLGVLAPWLWVVAASARLPARARIAGTGVIVLAFAILTTARASLFSEDLALWADAAIRAPAHPLPPYQLGVALRQAGRFTEAERAFRQTLTLTLHPGAFPAPERLAARATNDLGGVMLATGRLAEAIALYREATVRWPDDPKLAFNFAQSLARGGRDAEARAVLESIVRRFPRYPRARATLDALGPTAP